MVYISHFITLINIAWADKTVISIANTLRKRALDRDQRPMILSKHSRTWSTKTSLNSSIMSKTASIAQCCDRHMQLGHSDLNRKFNNKRKKKEKCSKLHSLKVYTNPLLPITMQTQQRQHKQRHLTLTLAQARTMTLMKTRRQSCTKRIILPEYLLPN